MVGVLGGAVGGLDFMTMFMSQASFRPIAIGSRRDLEDVVRVMTQHDVRPVIDSVFSFDDAAQLGAISPTVNYSERSSSVIERHGPMGSRRTSCLPADSKCD